MSEAEYMASVDTFHADKYSHEKDQEAEYRYKRQAAKNHEKEDEAAMIKCVNACPLGKFEGCCHSCSEHLICSEGCSETPDSCNESIFDEETALTTFKSTQLATLQTIAALTVQKKAIEEQEKSMKAVLYAAMEKFQIEKFESDVLNLTFVAPTTATSVDSPKLKKKYPDIFSECSKTSSRAGYVKITLKDESL